MSQESKNCLRYWRRVFSDYWHSFVPSDARTVPLPEELPHYQAITGELGAIKQIEPDTGRSRVDILTDPQTRVRRV